MVLVIGLWTLLRACLGGSVAVALENVALRHQLAILHRSGRRPKLHRWDRRMARENPTWGRRRIQAELHFLGYDVAELTVAKYMRRRSPRPSPTWRSFLETHLSEIAAIDFFVVPTLTFRLLFGFIVLRHDRRELVHINVTDHPTATWTARQIVEAFPNETAPRYLLRDRDAIYGDAFRRRVDRLGIHQVLIAPHAPWRNPFAERVIGSIRRECLDHFIALTGRVKRYLDDLRGTLARGDAKVRELLRLDEAPTITRRQRPSRSVEKS